MNITTREYAIEHDLKRYFTGEPCKNGHVSERRTNTRRCVECEQQITKKHRTPEQSRQYQRDWYSRNSSKKNKSCCLWQTTSPIGKTLSPKRRAAKLNATVSWADHEKIKAIYAERDRLIEETGIEHHVDHFYPLRSRWVCGLHNEFNLRVITAEENLKKGNQPPRERGEVW